MNSHEKNSLEVLMTEARILDARIEMAENHELKLRSLYEKAADELKFLKAQKKAFESLAKSITGQ